MSGEPFSIVVVTWNSAGELPGLIASLQEHLDAEYELLVVDCDSKDGSADLAVRLAPDAVVERLDENVGFARANNIGVRRATHDVVVLLNPDTLLVDGSLPALVELASVSGAVCGARLLNEDLSIQISAHPLVGGWEAWASALVPGRLMPSRLVARVEPWRVDDRRSVGWVSGACLAATKDRLIELGPFDEQLPLYGEDVDLGLRAHQAGIPVLFAPDLARVIHLGNRSAVQRFDDLGIERKLLARDWLIRERLSDRRAALDLTAQTIHFGVRRLAKPLVGRDVEYERAWLRALLRRMRRPASTRAEQESL